MNVENRILNQNIEHSIKVLVDACDYKIIDELKAKEVGKYLLKPSELKQCLQHGVSFFDGNREVSHKLWDLIVGLDLAQNLSEPVNMEENIYGLDADF